MNTTATVASLAGVIEPAGGDAQPEPPAGLDERLRTEWAELWDSTLRLVIGATSLPALRRLFELRQESIDAHRDCVDSPLVEGSQDQQVLNPRCRQATELDKEIRQLEDRFGLNPQAFVKLGLSKLVVEEAARRAAAAGDADTGKPERRDPRA